LTYEWQFVDNGKAKIIDTSNNNEKIVVQFDAVGKHAVKLIAKDDYGKIAEISKDIQVDSYLRPVISVVPVATSWGTPMAFSVASNVAISHYEWDFGDGDTRILQTDTVVHTYTRAGIYKVVLKVNAVDGTSNEVSRSVFV
jgi:PKD repeat protein